MTEAFDTARINTAWDVQRRRDPPRPNQIWRHQKHDPANGAWHEYDVLFVTSAPADEDLHMPQYISAIHAEGGNIVDVLWDGGDHCYLWDGSARQLFDEPYVVYRSTCDASGKCIARSLSDFLGDRNGHPRFTLIRP